MTKHYLLSFILYCTPFLSLFAQCPSGNVSLTSQTAIDDFIAQYPNCTTINGDLSISGNSVNDLSGLIGIEIIQENLIIQNTNSLPSLNGLQNITDIAGRITIYNADALVNLNGLNGQALQSLGGYLDINNNDNLIHINALNGLELIGQYITISNNASLQDLSGLSSLLEVNGDVTIKSNSSLPNLEGLQQIQEIEGDLRVENNSMLTDCSALCMLVNSNVIQGSFIILDAPAGCSSVTEVQIVCSTTPCPVGSFSLSRQDEVDAFVQTFSTCSTLEGTLSISGSITNISELSFLTHITGSLLLQNNTGTTSINGLENLVHIGEDVLIHNMDGLTHLDEWNGQQINNICGTLNIQYNDNLVNIDGMLGLEKVERNIWIQYNSMLSSIMGLGQLTEANAALTINNNHALTNLNGLGQLQEVEELLSIHSNNSLIDCSVLCNSLHSDVFKGGVNISNNPSECGSLTEIEILCDGGNCPVGDFTLNTQDKLDAFVQTYSTCTHLEGSLVIESNNVTDISGLSFLQTISGNFTFQNNSIITSFNGIENIIDIGGNCYIVGLTASFMPSLNIQNIGKQFRIANNTNLNDLSSFNQLETVGDYMDISYNNALANLDGLTALKTIGSYLVIAYNNNLTNVSGISQIQEIKGNLSVRDNPLLTDCTGICTLIENEIFTGILFVQNNPTPCSSATEIEIRCLIPPCPSGDFILNTQVEVDAFVASYAACTTLDGSLTLQGNNINDISGLSFLTTINGNLTIQNNNALTSLTGLQNLSTLNGHLNIYNADGLTDLTGLNGQQLMELGDYLLVRNNDNLANIDALMGLETVCSDLEFISNPALANLSGLSELLTVGGELEINNNDALLNLNPLQKLDLVEGNLRIIGNNLLSDCSDVCPLLHSDVTGTISISGNASFCSNSTEVLNSCTPSSCNIGMVNLSTQTEFNDFVTTHNSCNNLFGHITITGTVNDVSGLSFLNYLSGNLTFTFNSSLTSLSGIGQLEVVGDLTVYNCDGLTSLNGLGQVTVGRTLSIRDNDNITSLMGVESITELHEDLIVSNNPLLNDISALSNLTSIGGVCTINFNTALANLTGLEQLTKVDGNFNLHSSTNLIDCSAICNLLSGDGVDGVVNIYGNPSACSTALEIELGCVTSGCPEGSFTLTSQSEVDNFVTAYASCDSIKGNLTLQSSSSPITDISGLSFIEYIGGNFTFSGNHQITSLAGLDNLQQIEGDFSISSNNTLTSISNISQLDTINGSLIISANAQLANLNGLEQITFLKGQLALSVNPALNDISALSQLTKVEGTLSVYRNDNLTNLNGLDNISIIDGSLIIDENDGLVNCDGICNILNTGQVDGNINITQNPSPCSTTIEAQLQCATTACPENDIVLESQAEVDAFVQAFSNCASIPHSLTIQGNDITDLSGLNFIQHIGGYLKIEYNSSLNTLNGLDALKTIQSYFWIAHNNNLNNISALSQLEYIGGDLRLASLNSLTNFQGLEGLTNLDDNLTISSNNALTSLTGLQNLQSVEKDIDIQYNSQLTNMTALSTLSLVGKDFNLISNLNLNDCSTLCDLLDNEVVKGNINISNNAALCTTLEQIEFQCLGMECPVGDIMLENQAEVNAFATFASHCNIIMGNLTIDGNDINDISGLSFIQEINGDLSISYNTSLTNLIGLDNLHSVGGALIIRDNTQLTTIQALGQLQHIGENLHVRNNPALLNLNGLSQITALDDDLIIRDNAALQHIAALNGLCSVENVVQIYNNDALTNVNGLQQLSWIGGNLDISYNNVLTDCSAICALINTDAIDGNLTIVGNPSECSSPTEVTTLCSTSSCPQTHVNLNTQAEVNAFVSAFFGCDSLSYNLTITGGNNITDISGLSFLEYIGGDLKITNSHELLNLNGFQNLKGISGDLYIHNNDFLRSITQLSQLTLIDGSLTLSYNDSLQTLNGLMQLDSVSNNIVVRYNGLLNDCTILCDLINNNKIGGAIDIHNNPSQCSSTTEVTTFCSTADCPSGDVVLTTQSEVDAFAAIFSNCDSLPGNLFISGNNDITDISALSFITYIAGDFTFRSNQQLMDLTGLENLEKVGGFFKIEACNNLQDLSQLVKLDTVGGLFSIYNNNTLMTLNGLENMAYIGGDLTIRYNNQLSDCSSICNLIDNSSILGNLIVSNNLTDCNNADALQAFCTYGSAVSALSIQNLATHLEEGASLTFDIFVDAAPSETLWVNVISDNAIEVPLPSPLPIPPGETSINVTAQLPNDTIPEADEVVNISVGAAFINSANQQFTLTNDDDIPAIELEIVQNSLSETAGIYATQGIIRRLDDYDEILNVALSANVADALYLPDGISLAAGQHQKAFTFGVFDNLQVDGMRTVDITAKVLMASCNCTVPDNSVGTSTQQVVLIDNDGPTLSLQASQLSLQEGQPNAGTLTIIRNTPTDAPLTVNLNSNDETELTLPATITILQGASSIDVPITTEVDPTADGNQPVTVQATATDFSPGIIHLIVTDINKPDLQIAKVLLSSQEAPSFGQFPFRVFVTNTGFAAAPSGISLKGYLSNNSVIDDSDFLVGEYILDTAIPIGDTLEILNLGNTPTIPKDYYLLFRVNAEETTTELLYLNNTSEGQIITILPDYIGSAIVDEAIFEQGENIPIHGSSFKQDGTPVPNAELEVHITTGQIRRAIEVTTDANGDYMTVFEPFVGEAGYFEVGAGYPDFSNTNTDDDFNILGVRLNNGGYITWEVLLNDPLQSTLPVQNLCNVDLPNFTISPLALPNGCTLTFETLPILAANENTTINYEITGTAVTSLTQYLPIPLAIISDNNTLQEQTAYYFCQAQLGHLRSPVSSINTTISPENATIIEVPVFNEGVGETETISVDVPNTGWVNLKSSAEVASLQSGDTTLVLIEFIPDVSLPLNTPATGNIVINATNGNFLNIPFTVEKVSDAMGNVLVDVIDQYTYFTEEAPHVENASVKISHYFTGEVFAEGFTNSDGHFLAENLPEGTLRIVVQAHQHRGYDGIVVVQPGTTIDEVIFLEYQAISFSWDVVPTTIEDEYEISLIMEFETNVPVPVVVMEMPDTLPELVDDEIFSFFITLTNQGLITANEVEVILPEDPEYEFVTNYTPQNLLAQQAVQIPVLMKRRDNLLLEGEYTSSWSRTNQYLHIDPPSVPLRGSGGILNCRDVAYTFYWYECGDNGVWESTGEGYDWEGRVCSINWDELLPSINIGIGGGGGNNTGGGGDPIWPPGCSDCESNPSSGGSFPSINIGCSCNDCLKNLFLAGTSCVKGPVGVIGGAAYCIVRGGACNPLNPPDCQDAVFAAASTCGCTICDCVNDLVSIKYEDGTLRGGIKIIDAIDNLDNLLNDPDAEYIQIEKAKQDVRANTKTVLDKLIDFVFGAESGFTTEDSEDFHRNTDEIPHPLLLAPLTDISTSIIMERMQIYYVLVYFDTLALNDNFMDFLPLVAPNIQDTTAITMSQRSSILTAMNDYDMSVDAINGFIDNWNSTVAAWEIGNYVPNEQYPDIINGQLVDTLNMIFDEAEYYTFVRGYDNPTEMAESAMTEIATLSKPSADPNQPTAFNAVCASVSIQISQRLTMTREAFEGTLTIYNGHGTDNIENLSLDLEILDENGVYSNDLFEIETSELNVLTGIDGMGSLAAEQEGFAKILFIPERGAAPETPQNYSFGGSISYLDPFTGTMVTMPLIPATLQVNPSPDLFLHYFMDRDIYGDDPLTLPIEPIIPGELAVMIENNGYGVAQNVVIESAQPEIIDNDKGLAINFSLIGSNLQGEPANLGLNTIFFGNISPLSTKIGQWYFTSDLLGHFTNYQTNLVHLDSRGNPELSLISGVELHELIQSITVYGASEDGVDDFLVNEVPDAADAPDALYLSQGNLVLDVFTATSGAFSDNILAPGNTTTLEVDPLGLGWNYIQLDDPGYGNFEIVSVTRNHDSQLIPIKNAWLTHVTIPDQQVPIYEDNFHFIDIFDSFDPVTYTVVWSPKDPNPPSVVEITGHPSELTGEQVTTLRIVFSEEINDDSFTHEDLMLKFQGGDNIMDASVSISPIDAVTYEVDISSLTMGNGFYVFTAQAAGIEDLTGTLGEVGEQATWTQFLDAPTVQEFIGLPENNVAAAYDMLSLRFNVPINTSTFTIDDIEITQNGMVQSGTLTLELLDMENRLFKLSGLGTFMPMEGELVPMLVQSRLPLRS